MKLPALKHRRNNKVLWELKNLLNSNNIQQAGMLLFLKEKQDSSHKEKQIRHAWNKTNYIIYVSCHVKQGMLVLKQNNAPYLQLSLGVLIRPRIL